MTNEQDLYRHLKRAHDRIDQLEADLRDQTRGREQMARRSALEYVGRTTTTQDPPPRALLDQLSGWVLTGDWWHWWHR